MPEVRPIDANALKKAIADAFYNLHEIAYIADIIERQPTIEPEVRHGRWIVISRCRITESRDLKCSVCGNYFRVYDDVTLNGGRGDANFCPNCGARMDAKDINVLTKDGGADNG